MVLPALLNNPYAIYERAREVWQQARYPAVVAYTVHVAVTEAGAQKSNHYRLTYDALHDVVHVDPASDEERAHPHVVPPGPNVNFFSLRLSRAEPRTDYLGVPLLAPNYSFGIAHYVPKGQLTGMDLVREIRKEFHDPAKRTPPPASGLPEIANVEAIAHDYDIKLAGLEPIAGHTDYHLVLHPVRDPKRYRLRDIWIDDSTYFTDRLVSDGNFVSGPGPGVQWTVDFAEIGGAPYIARETASGSLSYPGAVYTSAAVLFEDVHGTKPTPAWAGASAVSGDTLEEPR